MNRSHLAVIALLATGATSACSSPSGSDGGTDVPSATDGTDATAVDGQGTDVTTDAGTEIATPDAADAIAPDGTVATDGGTDVADVITPVDGDGSVVATGLVYGEYVAGTDSGVPGRGPLVAAATVTVLAQDGTVLARGTTNTSGQYSLNVPGNTTVLIEVGPVADHAGLIRGENTLDTDYMSYDLVLPLISGLQTVAGYESVTYDPTLGWVSVGFNPASPTAGGEGAHLASSVTHAPGVNLVAGGAVVSDTLSTVCTGGADAGCVSARANVVMFPDVAIGQTTVTPVSPTGATCTERFGVTNWPVHAGVVTSVSIDCD